MRHMAFRARSQQALERRVAALKGSGYDIGWTDGDLGQEPAFLRRDPDGHMIELYYKTEWYQAPPELKPALKNQAQRFPARGINVRRLDHLNCLASDIRANRVEVCNASARSILASDWKTIVWTEEEHKKGQAWGMKTVESFHTYGPPPIEEME